MRTPYELRAVDAGVKDMANRVADGLNAINDALERMGRLKVQTAKEVARRLGDELAKAIKGVEADSFSQAMVAEAVTLAEAKKRLAAMEQEEPVFSAPAAH